MIEGRVAPGWGGRVPAGTVYAGASDDGLRGRFTARKTPIGPDGRFRFEAMSRRSNVPYFAGHGGTTTAADGFPSTLPFTPDGVKNQTLLTAAINFRL